MQQKWKMEATYPEQSKYESGPSYAEILELVQSSYGDIRRSKTNEESSIRNILSSAFRIPSSPLPFHPYTGIIKLGEKDS